MFFRWELKSPSSVFFQTFDRQHERPEWPDLLRSFGLFPLPRSADGSLDWSAVKKWPDKKETRLDTANITSVLSTCDLDDTEAFWGAMNEFWAAIRRRLRRGPGGGKKDG